MNTINYFDKEYAFLSNFYSCPVTYKGITYKNSEAAFQAQKCISAQARKGFANLQAYAAKRLGRQIDLRNDWDDIKLTEMYEIVLAKFSQNIDLKAKLFATGDALLIEGNYWHDQYWGVCPINGEPGKDGENHLGIILMHVRDKLRKEN